MAAMRGKKARNHTEPCRNGFMKVFESTPQGRERIEEDVEMMENSRSSVQGGKNDEVELEDRALDAVFEAPRWTQEEEEAAKATAAAEAAIGRASAESDEDRERRKRPRWCHLRKRKLEEDAKQQEEDAKRQKQEEDERKLAAKTCGDDPRPKLDFVIEMEFPKASVGVRGDQVILASSEATNKKFSKDAVLVSWTIDVSCKEDVVDTKEWNVNWKTEVIWKNNKKGIDLTS